MSSLSNVITSLFWEGGTLSEKDLATLCATLSPVMAEAAYVYARFQTAAYQLGYWPFASSRSERASQQSSSAMMPNTLGCPTHTKAA